MDKLNHEHYQDLTAYQALKNIELEEQEQRQKQKEEERYNKFLGCIFRICELSGYHIEERIVVKDLRTGKIWR